MSLMTCSPSLKTLEAVEQVCEVNCVELLVLIALELLGREVDDIFRFAQRHERWYQICRPRDENVAEQELVQVWHLPNDAVVDEPPFDRPDDAFDIAFLFHEVQAIRERDRGNDIERIPVHLSAKIDVLPDHASHLTHEDGRTRIIHRLKFLERAQRVRTCKRPLNRSVLRFISDSERRRSRTSWRLDIKRL